MITFPQSLFEFQKQFPDAAACASYLFDLRWPDGFHCPECGSTRSWELNRQILTHECADCGKQTSVTAGTIMHGSKLSLAVWFWAAYLMATHSNGVSALQLQQQLGLGSYKTAWLLAAKLRKAMVAPERLPLAGLVEVDETEVSCRSRGDPVVVGGGRSAQGKLFIAGAVEVIDKAPGRIRLATIDNFSAESLHPFVASAVKDGATIKTDGWSAYPSTPNVHHEPHVIGPMAAHMVLPWVHRVFSNLKTWALGVYHGLRRGKHIQAYLDEFTFRFNRRRARHAAFKTLLNIGTKTNPITYNMLIKPELQG